MRFVGLHFYPRSRPVSMRTFLVITGVLVLFAILAVASSESYREDGQRWRQRYYVLAIQQGNQDTINGAALDLSRDAALEREVLTRIENPPIGTRDKAWRQHQIRDMARWAMRDYYRAKQAMGVWDRKRDVDPRELEDR